eukprot:gene25430-30705_t
MSNDLVKSCFLEHFPDDLSNEDVQKIEALLVPVPRLEVERIGTLRSVQLLDTPAESSYDRYTNLCARVFKTPICLISLVDVDRQWFKSRVGLEVSQTHRNTAFCAYTVHECSDDVFIVRDATKDPRFCDNPLVTGFPHICFYAGAALIVQGQKIGSLCIIDTKPRPDFNAADAVCLREIATIVEQLIEERRQRFMQTESDLARMTVSILYTLRYPLKALQLQKDALLRCAQNIQQHRGNNIAFWADEAFLKVLDEFRRGVSLLEATIQANLQLALAFSNSSISSSSASADVRNFKHMLSYVKDQENPTNRENIGNHYLKELQKMRSQCSEHALRWTEVMTKLQCTVSEFGTCVSDAISWQYPGNMSKSGESCEKATCLLNTNVIDLFLNAVLIQNIFKHKDFSAKINCRVANLHEFDLISKTSSNDQVGRFVMDVTFFVPNKVQPLVDDGQDVISSLFETGNNDILTYLIKSAEGNFSFLCSTDLNAVDDEQLALVYSVSLPCIVFNSDSHQFFANDGRMSNASTFVAISYNNGDILSSSVCYDTDKWCGDSKTTSSDELDDVCVLEPTERRRVDTHVKSIAKKYWRSIFSDAQQRVVPI